MVYEAVGGAATDVSGQLWEVAEQYRYGRLRRGRELRGRASARGLPEPTSWPGANDGKTICVATHATPIRSVICSIYGMTGDRAKDVPWVGNASVTVAEYEDGVWRLPVVNETSHLGDMHTEFGKGV